ncbi:hypothetical protein F2Q68_00007184 [Brassica cretica]|uniref:Uncharacterized protein n=1 Tax=Brassica cretica TaxID=69181 RepID=A0A8S9L3J9_BRACR|nr:hypothetical protein F2Q68_00007184 [Brassica cretica]
MPLFLNFLQHPHTLPPVRCHRFPPHTLPHAFWAVGSSGKSHKGDSDLIVAYKTEEPGPFTEERISRRQREAFGVLLYCLASNCKNQTIPYSIAGADLIPKGGVY